MKRFRVSALEESEPESNQQPWNRERDQYVALVEIRQEKKSGNQRAENAADDVHRVPDSRSVRVAFRETVDQTRSDKSQKTAEGGDAQWHAQPPREHF